MNNPLGIKERSRASRYYNCCTDGSTSPGNYGYPLVFSSIYDSYCGPTLGVVGFEVLTAVVIKYSLF
jgi:hypothetical protein